MTTLTEADTGTRLHLVPHIDGLLLLLLGRPGHQEHGPDEHDEREEGHETHGFGTSFT